MKPTDLSFLATFMQSPEFDRYFGRGFIIRAEVLVRHLSGQGTLTDIARKHGLSKPALSRYSARAAAIFGPPATKVYKK